MEKLSPCFGVTDCAFAGCVGEKIPKAKSPKNPSRKNFSASKGIIESKATEDDRPLKVRSALS